LFACAAVVLDAPANHGLNGRQRTAGGAVDVRTTPEFDDWLASLADQRAYTKVLVRIRDMAKGYFGDCKPIGQGLSESRIHHGPGYRLYFARRGRDLVVLLAGGDKSSQRRDVVKAKRLAAGL